MFKEVITIFLSTVVFHDELTPINISGLCVALVGIALYNYLKYRNYKIIEKRVLENGGSIEDLQNSASREDGNGEAELEALHSSRSRREHDGGQFQLVGEDDFDSSDDSDEEDDTSSRRKEAKGTNGPLYDDANLDGIERLPPYAETHPNTSLETRQMEEKVNHDPMLLDLEREEERLESEMDNTRHASQTSNSKDLLFDADEGDIDEGKQRQQG